MEKARNRHGTNEVERSTDITKRKDQLSEIKRAKSPPRSRAISDFGFRIGAASRIGNRESAIVNLLALGILLLAVLSVSSIGTETGRDEPVPSFDEFLVIPEQNMFSSRRQASKDEARTEPRQRSVPTTAPADIEVIGIVKARDPLSSIAIIKDHGRHVPCRVGDTVGGMLITEIRTSEIFFETAAGTWIAKIQPGMTPSRLVVPEVRKPTSEPLLARISPAAGAGRRVSVDATAIKHLARTLPLVTDREGDQVKGLRLTQDVMGLREGDRVTSVGGQSLYTKYPKQKLLQITRKYRQYGNEMPEIPVVVERGQKKLELVLVPAS